MAQSAGTLFGQLFPLDGSSAAEIHTHLPAPELTQAVHLLCLLGLTGNYDKPGANFPTPPFSYNYQGGGFLTHEADYMNSTRPESKNPRIGAGRFPVWNMIQDEFQAMDLPRQILEGKPYPVKALLGFGLNLLMFPGTEMMRRALKAIDFFVAIDLFDTPACKYADIVLPACSSFERGELRVYPSGHAFFTSPVIDPLYDSRSDTDIITELARRLCPQDTLLCQGYEASIDYILQDLSISVASLKAAGVPVPVPEAQPPVIGETWKNGLPTPSGKFEFCSNMLKMCGVNPVPNYPEELYHPEGKRGYLLSTGVRMAHTLHSRLHKVPVLRSLRPEPMADISLEDAQKLGLNRGNWVRLTTDGGSLKIRVNPTSTVLKGTIHLYHGYEEVSANELLTPDSLDPCTGFPTYKSIACDMEPCVE